MKVAIIYNKDVSKVINRLGIQNKEIYNPKTVMRVAKCLEDGGHNVDVIDGDMHVIERIHDFMPQVVEGEKMGIVFNMAYGIQGESRYTHIPSMLEMLGIPYVGSSPAGHALALDKVVTKMILQQHGLPTPKFWVFNDPESITDDVEFPVIVKPKMESVSFGLRVVDDYAELKDAVKYIIDEFEQAALVEQFIPGREFAVGLLGNNPVEAFPILEIDLENDPNAIQTHEDKSKAPRAKICPAVLTDDLAIEITKVSIESFKALQLKDFARVDLRMDSEGKIYILELNSMASLGPTGSYPQAASVAGYDYKSLVNKMLDVAVLRYFVTSEFGRDADQVYNKVPMHVRMRSFLRGRQPQINKFLKEMVNTTTHVRNVEGVQLLSNLIKKQMSTLGFSYKTIPQVEVGNILFFTNSEDADYDVLLLGNLDNSTKLSEHEYYHVSEQKIFGTGIWENKGGLAIMIAALQALRFVKQLKKLKIGVLLTSDDSLQGRFAREHVKHLTQDCKYVLGLHGAFLDGGLVTSRSGAAFYHVNMSLVKPADASDVAESLSIFHKHLAGWIDLSDRENGLAILPQKVQMESDISDPYAHASLNLSVRFNDLEQMKIIDKKIRKPLPAKYKKIINLQVDGGLRRPAMLKTEKVIALWNKVKTISAKLDINLREEHRWSSADICFVDDKKFVMDGFGPSGANPSKKSEFILKHSILERATLLAVVLSELKLNGID
ncbi:MAG: ATP-grasp domain-containing protein [Bacteroidetes bacterium]|nr:ATP-grasp domain-containing protein [Bacteroidota bacterium]